MNIERGEIPGELILDFNSPEEFEQFFEQAERDGYFTLDITELPPGCHFRARMQGSPRTRKIRPTSVIKQNSTYQIHIVDPLPAAEQPPAEEQSEIKELLDLIAQQKEQKNKLEENQIGNTEVGKSLFDKIRALTVTERVTLALKADLMERRILMQENNSKINEFLLKNVRITDQEVAQMVRNPGVPLQNLLAIAGNRIWMNNEAVRIAILTNPRTPPAMVLEMIPSASSGELTRMFQSAYLREDIKSTVKRELKRRGVRVRENPSF